ncbi:hypothetical protein AVEN_118024-1 [Araneus ventricosus]|uniref:RNase H type-1 domain-containing protein n=1 Tax=Araneus ventricosus TaxID=182803 RepID=A0A4Y2CA72_ARAVE|nr:hypothetical protein AVEN_118024-1 [Araneus ventricosus]
MKDHVGNPGNELSDHSANLATVEGQEIDIPAPYTCMKHKCKRIILGDWEIYWKKYESVLGRRVRSGVDPKHLISNKFLIYFFQDADHSLVIHIVLKY